MLQQEDDTEPEAQSESPEAADGSDEAEPEKAEAEQSVETDEAEGSDDAGQPESTERPVEPGPVEVPASLVEPVASASGEDAGGAATTGDDSRTRMRPLSPRDIVRAANAAARTRAEAARVAVDF